VFEERGSNDFFSKGETHRDGSIAPPAVKDGDASFASSDCVIKFFILLSRIEKSEDMEDSITIIILLL